MKISFLSKLSFCILLTISMAQARGQESSNTLSTHVSGFQQINPTTVDIIFSDKQRLTVDFYGDQIFRMFQDTSGGIIRDPEAVPAAQILVSNPRRPVHNLTINEKGNHIEINTSQIKLIIDKSTSLFTLINTQTNKTVLQSAAPIKFGKSKVSIDLKEEPSEYFYGGGVQNGRFSHKGKTIAIENQNSWTDNGVASPTPFYWSTNGYGFMWYTFKQGKYDFGAKQKGIVELTHNTDYLDVFFMVGDGAKNVLNDFYQLTGNPILLPKFGFYEGHLNAYNRDYWKEDSIGISFEDGKKYRESQKNNGGIKESLNGEKNNYQFSARGVIDRYKSHDMPLGWILPNDGYGAGYGQTSTLDSNIANLKSLGDYARKNGVQIGLWTQSDLHPKAGISELLQRDIVKEIRDAGVRVLKTDVAWVGAGYSFGLNGVSEVGGHIMPYYGDDARPFIISLDGWAGTQRYASVWTGDQTGGEWEYIRFHIPTYIGSGLSGQPNITSDMDGIFGGKNSVVNTRDFQWKTFTPMQLNMDGWGANEKYPHALGEPVTSINRNYLKWKSRLVPYTYSIAKEAVDGLPIIRAMFLEITNDFTLGKATQYQYMYGPYFLIAPIYQNTKADKSGNDIRNNIYLPEGLWYDYFTGEKYEGGRIINSYDAPLWKLPVFVKAGAIIPMTNNNNHVSEIDKSKRIYEIYPFQKSSFTEYDDDGFTESYKNGIGVSTLIESTLDKAGNATIVVQAAKGNYNGLVKQKTTEFLVNISAKPKAITAKIGNKNVPLLEVKSLTELQNKVNVYYFETSPNLNSNATIGSEFSKEKIVKNPLLHIKIAPIDITTNSITVTLKSYQFNIENNTTHSIGHLEKPLNAQVLDSNKTAYTLKPSWTPLKNADYYEILFDGMKYSTIKDSSFLFEGLTPVTDYSFKLRAVNKAGASDWVDIATKTSVNPLEFAIKGIVGTSTASDQEGDEIGKLFDFDPDNIWHTEWGKNAVPFDVVIDLKSVNQLDRLEYLPRLSGVNGMILKGTIAYSLDKNNWENAGDITWARTPATKTLQFPTHPTARYLKIHVDKAYGNFGSGREIYVFKVPGSETILPGDINNDHKIDNNDLTSYINYTGLRKGDGDFEGYISKGDINQNNLIDAYDISVVATQMNEGVDHTIDANGVEGKIEMIPNKSEYEKGEEVELLVKGIDLKNVNALSFAIPYDANDFEYVGIKSLNLLSLDNLTYDRLHSNREKVLYPTFVNIGEKPVLNGSKDLFILKMKAKRKIKMTLQIKEGLLVDKNLESSSF